MKEPHPLRDFLLWTWIERGAEVEGGFRVPGFRVWGEKVLGCRGLGFRGSGMEGSRLEVHGLSASRSTPVPKPQKYIK